MRTPRLKSPDDVVAELAARLERDWHRLVCGDRAWSPVVNLGSSHLRGPALREHWHSLHLDSLDWAEWAQHAGVVLRTAPVRHLRTDQSIPAAVVIESPAAAARLIGAGWSERLRVAEARHGRLVVEFPQADHAAVLRTTQAWSDVDFDLLCRTARWFTEPHESGLTARQVPVEGLGTKWLGQREGVVRRLAGVDSLGLVPGRPQRVHLTYLDPAHLRSGGRRHDVVTDGDDDTVAYAPRLVVISENRDTAQLFPELPGGIAIEGDGSGPGLVPWLAWVRAAERVVYWGDMDARGLEILDAFRAAGVAARSVLMDLAAYERWERFGVDEDHDGKRLRPRTPRPVPHLTDEERELYLALCSPQWSRPRRIEQERIPLDLAAEVVRSAAY